jgi:hypothetical protein
MRVESRAIKTYGESHPVCHYLIQFISRRIGVAVYLEHA